MATMANGRVSPGTVQLAEWDAAVNDYIVPLARPLVSKGM